MIDTPEPTVQHEILVTTEPTVQQEILVTNEAPERNEIVADENEEEEESQATETEPTTHQLTHRSTEDDTEDKMDKWVSIKSKPFPLFYFYDYPVYFTKYFQGSQDDHLKDIEEWNFSSVEDKSLAVTPEQRQQEMINNMFRIKKKDKVRRNTVGNDEDDEKATSDCFNNMMLQFFVKVFD